ncbi:MAG: hypothetical protein QXQ70_02275 [Candidatus Caldarchaeum sp.]
MKRVGPRIVFMNVKGSAEKIEVKQVELLDQQRVRRVFTNRQRTLKKLMEFLDNYDILVTWGGGERDVPLLTAWTLHVGIDPSPLHSLTHLDLKHFVKQFLMLNEPELEKTARFLRIKSKPDKLRTLEALFEKLRRLLKTLKPELAL